MSDAQDGESGAGYRDPVDAATSALREYVGCNPGVTDHDIVRHFFPLPEHPFSEANLHRALMLDIDHGVLRMTEARCIEPGPRWS